MTKRGFAIRTSILVLLGLALVFELVRDSMKSGDFIGYVNAGNLVLSGQNIYSDPLNTWPPFFSIFSVPLALGDSLSSVWVRFIWLLGSIFAMYGVIVTTVDLSLDRPLRFSPKGAAVLWQESLVFIPLLILFRFILDNLANVQINIFILLCSLLAIIYFIKKRYVWAGLLLGLTISLKVYPIFFLLYFIFKREYKVAAWSLFFIGLFGMVPLLVFGVEQGLEYYRVWVEEVIPKSHLSHHKNQSIFGLFLRFLTTEIPGDPGNYIYVNFLRIPIPLAKKLTYLAVGLASLYPAYVFRDKIKEARSMATLLEFSIIFTVVPILSPISWKAYFIFLWMPYFLLYLLLFQAKNGLNKPVLIRLRGLFWFSVLLTVGSSELFVGNYFSDVLEAYSAITFGSLILLGIQVFVYQKLHQFDLKPLKLAGSPP